MYGQFISLHQITVFGIFKGACYCIIKYCFLFFKCSNTCGEGWQMRRVECYSFDQASTAGCSEIDKPIDYQGCNVGPCPQWNHGPWGEVCSIDIRVIL